MGQLSVTIAGRTYRLACEEGEEDRLVSLAQLVDAKIAALRQRFGELGDQRLVLMAAITFADDWLDAKERFAELESELARLKAAQSAAAHGREGWAVQVAASLGEAALRIEQVAQELNESARD